MGNVDNTGGAGSQASGGTLVDGAAAGQSQVVDSGNLNGTGNGFIRNIQANDTVATGASSNYEKAGLLVEAQTSDPSGANTLDMVGVDARGYIANNNPSGRVWGSYFEGRVQAGGSGDGYVVGSEMVSNNNGTDQASPGTTTSKYAAHFVAAGANPSTGAIYIGGTPRGTGSSTKFHKGLYMETAALNGGASDSFIELQSTWRVVSTTGAQLGCTLIGSATAGFASTLLEVQGPNSTADPLVAIGSATNTQSYSLRVLNAAGTIVHFIAGGGGAFLTATAAGDGGVKVQTATKAYHIGGTTKVISVNQGNQLGFFAVSPVAQPSAVGAAAGYVAGATVATFHSDDTYSGNTGTTGYTINGIVAALKNLGLIAT